jgi:uncharacterized repeat protein (TIGR01451 family)
VIHYQTDRRDTVKTKYLLISFALGLGLALAWVLGGKGGAAVAAWGAEGHIDAPGAPAAELHVCPSGCAYASIQDAVDAAADGDVIKVAAGTYTGVNNHGGLAQVVYIDKTVTVRGGYTTDNWTTSDPESNPTTLDAMRQGRVLCIWGDISPTIEGLQMVGGDATGLGGSAGSVVPSPDAGGAVYIVNAAATIRNNRIMGNSADRGGGLYLLYSAATLHGNQVSGNTASEFGGGVYLIFSDATLSGNAVISNTSWLGGGLAIDGMAIELSVATLSENVILFNTATGNGGGLALADEVMMINNVVADNRASGVGSGLAVYGSSSRLLHTTFAQNRGGDGSGVFVDSGTVALTNTTMVSQPVGVYVASGATARLEGTLWGSGAWANATDWDGDGAVITGTVNIWGDPAFVDPNNGDYHIGAGSAAVDAGVDAGVDDDIDGDDRPLDGNLDGTDEFDIGADEFRRPSPDLVITKRATPDQVQPGGQLTYTISVANTGDLDLQATITDTLPFSVTLGGTLIPAGGTLILLDGKVAVTWTAVITAPGGLWMGTILVTVDEGHAGSLTNLVEVTTEEGATGEAVAIVNAQKVYLPLMLGSFP